MIVGRLTTRVLLKPDTLSSDVAVEVSEPELQELLDLSSSLNEAFQISIFSKTVGELENNVENMKAARRQFLELSKKHDDSMSLLVEMLNRVSGRGQDTSGIALQDLCVDVMEFARTEPWKLKVSPRSSERGKRIEEALGGIRLARPARAIILGAMDLLDEMHPLYQVLGENATSKGLTFQVVLDGRALAAILENKCKWLRLQIQRFSLAAPSASQLREFLRQCDNIFQQLSRPLANKHVAQSLGLADQKLYLQQGDEYRLRVPIHLLFDTGSNLSVFGEAGSGKTTSLQMYALRRLRAPHENDLVIFVPLTRLIAQASAEPKTDSDLERLIQSLVSFISTIGVPISTEELRRELSRRRVILLLDGVDEIIGAVPWLLGAVRQLSSAYPNAQIVMSSRMFGRYVDEVPFLGVTLLPFTDAQRDDFIRKYFKGKTAFIDRVIGHIKSHPELASIVRNPLLATIMCVLAERGVPLPRSELRLFEERMRLFLGHYDIHKGARRIQSDPTVLQQIAQRLAFDMQFRGERYKTRQEIVDRALQLAAGLGPVDRARIAIEELIHPCDVLVPMTADGKLGFGHLRFQEYLAAVELKQDRNIKIRPLLSQIWWKDSLVLFAQMCSSLHFVAKWVVSKNLSGAARRTAEAMIDVRPSAERAELMTLIDKADAWKQEILITGRPRSP